MGDMECPLWMTTVTRTMEFTYLYRQATLALPEAFGECPFKHLQRSIADLSLHLIAPTCKDLDVQSDKSQLRIAISYKVLFMPDGSAFDVGQGKKPGPHESVVNLHEKPSHIRPIDNVCGVLEYAMWHSDHPLLLDRTAFMAEILDQAPGLITTSVRPYLFADPAGTADYTDLTFPKPGIFDADVFSTPGICMQDKGLISVPLSAQFISFLAGISLPIHLVH